jgi:ABC-type glycerol-3-phosphate transport system substrate-binding protein
MPKDSRRYSSHRRKFLKGVAVAGGTLVAGCTGNGGNDSGSDGSGGGGSSGSDGGGSDGSDSDSGTSTGSTGGRYSDITIEYWNRFHNNSGEAEQAIKQGISAFEEETGATVNVDYSSGEPGQRWLTLAREGERPHIMDHVAGQVGPFVELDIIKPFPDYQDLFSDELVDQASWLMDDLGASAYSGYGGEAYEFKFSTESPRLFLARRDHLDEAGLSPEDDFPPTSYQESIELGRTLQEEGPGENGWQIYGTSSDVTDTCTEDWPIADHGHEGQLVNRDWTDTLIDTEPIIGTYENFVSIFTEHGLSSQGTVSQSDEDATQLLIRGNASMTQVPSATYADLLSNAPEMVRNGDFVFGSAWKGETGSRGITGGDGVVFTQPPQGANQSDWNRAQEAAADLLENYLYYSQDFQRRMFSTIGGGPIREDVTPEQIRGAVDDPTGYEESNIIDAFYTAVDDQEQYYFQPAAPMFGQIQYEIMPGYIQQAMQGEMTVEEGLNQAAEEARSQFF